MKQSEHVDSRIKHRVGHRLADIHLCRQVKHYFKAVLGPKACYILVLDAHRMECGCTIHILLKSTTQVIDYMYFMSLQDKRIDDM